MYIFTILLQIFNSFRIVEFLCYLLKYFYLVISCFHKLWAGLLYPDSNKDIPLKVLRKSCRAKQSPSNLLYKYIPFIDQFTYMTTVKPTYLIILNVFLLWSLILILDLGLIYGIQVGLQRILWSIPPALVSVLCGSLAINASLFHFQGLRALNTLLSLNNFCLLRFAFLLLLHCGFFHF